ncbi:NUDIX domain-containing protein [Phreatobacter stygius]|uniref:NUDIX domain-containing protein n=1 Tax=Phreatobacter stygius TaxID=1940610 RepID=A0A4D7BJ11_9HYPH|nr:NUDIX domain-containing protein [Phreatobacter stygius]
MIHRQAVRAILLTPDNEVLLMRLVLEGFGPFWIAPGGGIEAGEGMEQAMRRELKEEVGLDRFEMGPLIWRRQHTFTYGGRRLCQREDYFAIHVRRFDPVMSDEIEVKVLDSFRWWTPAELCQASERLTPLALADIVERYLTIGPPRELPEIEVLVD